jgi:thiamine biosynthesis protein ThiI
MKKNVVIIRYGELALKSMYVRRRFESILINNIRSMLNKNNIEGKIVREWGRIYLYTNDTSKALLILPRVFGVTSISPATRIDSTLSSISAQAVELMSENLKGDQSFALRVTRTGDHPYTSQDAAVIVGDEIRRRSHARVDLVNPDVELFIEIRDRYAYLFFDRIKGPGGFPLGAQGRVAALIDKAESLLAAWYMMRRGCNVSFIVLNEDIKTRLDSFIDTWYICNKQRIRHVDEHGDLHEIKRIIDEEDVHGVVTGFSLSIDNDIWYLKKLKNALQYPILSPLIMFNQEDIEEHLSRISVSI